MPFFHFFVTRLEPSFDSDGNGERNCGQCGGHEVRDIEIVDDGASRMKGFWPLILFFGNW